MLCLVVLVGGLTATAQVLPTSSGSCVAAASSGGCHWVSTIKIRKAETITAEVADDSNSELFLTLFRIGPGAPLDSQAIVGGEVVLIVGKNNGEVTNEKKLPSNHIDVYDGLVMLMPKGEPYLLRNVGKDYVDLLVIEVRERTPKPRFAGDPGR
jgi:mannose-6-phosphate isomerase-like protein (cupin superfamily)